MTRIILTGTSFRDGRSVEPTGPTVPPTRLTVPESSATVDGSRFAGGPNHLIEQIEGAIPTAQISQGSYDG